MVQRAQVVCRWITAAGSARELLDRTVLGACDLLQIPVAWCALLIGGDLHVAAHHGLRSTDLAKLWCLPVDAGTAGGVAASGRTVVIHDWGHDPCRLPANPSIVEAEGVCSGIVAPLCSEQGILGLLSLGDRQERALPLLHVEITTELAAQAGEALCLILAREGVPPGQALGVSPRVRRRAILPRVAPGSWNRTGGGTLGGYAAAWVPNADHVA